MPLHTLPVELLTPILDQLIPHDWHDPAELRRRCLELRLVCRLFDSIVSRAAFQKTDLVRLRWQSDLVNKRSVKWLLHTKAGLDPEGNIPVIAHLHQWASFMSAQKDWNSDHPTSADQWFDAVCGAAILQLGAPLALENLVCYSGGGKMKLQGLSLCLSQSLLGRQRPQGPKGAKIVQMTHGLLQIASYQGNTSAVKLMLKDGSDPNYRHSYFGHALFNAVFQNHIEILRLLVEHGAKLHNTEDFGPLIRLAAERGHTEPLRYLLTMARVDQIHSAYLNHCLLIASARGHEGVVRVLCEWADNKKGRKFYGWIQQMDWIAKKRPPILDLNFNYKEHGPPLTAAVKNGHMGVVRFLLDRKETQAFRKDEHCPFATAVKHDRLEVVTLLLGRYKVSPSSTLLSQRTLLCSAAGLGSVAVVGMLVKQKDLDPNGKAHDGDPTPLWLGVHNGHTEVVRELLSRTDIDPNSRHEKLTPLANAVKRHHKSIVRLLLQCPRVDPNLQSEGVTPLISAIHLGRLDIMVLLLERPDTDPNLLSGSNNFSSPLWVAVRRGDITIVQELLRRSDVNPNMGQTNKDGYGLPLLFAARIGNYRIVKLLLAHNDIDVNIAGSSRHSLLAQAVHRKDNELVNLLLAHPDIDINYAPEMKEGPRTH